MNFDKDRYIGYVEMALGVGDMVGPAIGGLVFEVAGFSGTFAVFGGMITVGIILSVIWIPKRLNIMSFQNSKIIDDQDQGESLESEEEEELG